MLNSDFNNQSIESEFALILNSIKENTELKEADAIFRKAQKSLKEFPFLKKQLLEKQTNYYSKIREYKKLEVSCSQLIDFYAEARDYSNLAMCNLKMGIVFRSYGNYEKAIEFNKKAFNNFKKVSDEIGLIKALNNIGNLYKDQGEFNLALEKYLTGKAIVERIKHVDLGYLININLAEVYSLLNYDKKAKELYTQDLKVMIQEKKYARVATCLTGIAEIQLKNNKPFKAKKTIKNAIHYWLKHEDKRGLGEAYLILGKIFNHLGKNEEAILQFLKSNQNYESVYHNHGSISALSLLGKSYLQLNDKDTAKKYLKKAKEKAEEIKASFELLEVYDLLHKIYHIEGKHNLAYEALLNYNQIREKVFNLSSQVQINEIQTKYELDKQELSHLKEREVSDYKFNLFANLTHEFRTPLTLIKAPIELIKDEENISTIKEKVEYIERNTEHLLKLVNQLLDINKIEAGKMPISLKVGNIAPLIGHVVHLFTEDASQKNINFTYNIPNNDIQGVFDEDKLEKILFNLLSNALKFTPSQGRIHLQVQTHNEQMVIKVIDNGPGISLENQKLVFEKYYRVNQNGKIAGSGIGLSFVKELVDLLEGTIEIGSKLSSGTTFTVRLPFKNMKNKEVFAEEVLKLEPRIVPISGDLISNEKNKKPLLLIVEDNVEIQKLIVEIFSSNYKILKANNGAEGIKYATEMLPDMVISDIMMPIKDGYELTKTLKSDIKTNHIPIILLTAKTNLNNKIEGIEIGADAYLSKPFSIVELKAQVENIIQQRNQLRVHYAQNALFTTNSDLISADEVFIKSATDQVLANIHNESYSVEDLAHSFNMSRFTLIRKFKSVLNNTPNDFIQKIRLETAKNMLTNKVATISEIGYNVGFASVTYFSSSFKKEYGISPRDFMNNVNKNISHFIP